MRAKTTHQEAVAKITRALVNQGQGNDFIARLCAEMEEAQVKSGPFSTRTRALTSLMALCMRAEATTYDGWHATLLAGFLGLPAPTWAIEKLVKAEDDTIGGFTTIDVALGFKGQGKGGSKNSPAQRARQSQLTEALCVMVRLFVRGGESLASACRTVAERCRATPNWNETVYSLRRPNPSSLSKIYRRWEQNSDKKALALFDKSLDACDPAILERIRRLYSESV